MEQATNLFNAGLLMDTHPMVLGNDTLTDALNATLITMNGNEVILLNDMGNRRVDNAFLPAGYEPVGIKEYGGIIYIAAYNPITNKSQIGSFPSPERKISSDDIKDILNNSFEFGNLENYTTTKGIRFLKSDTILIPLTKEETLHAGDKFVVYSEGLANIKSDITNYENTTGSKVTTSKNKKYTLSLGVLNSQNEFVDITKTLCRWKLNTDPNPKPIMLEYTNKSDLFIFNDAYFIATGEPEGLNYSETLDDLELIKERLIMPANTYAYKLVGPLYLKAELNHILDFNFNIYGVKTNTALNGVVTADLYIEAFITYNCPDWITPSLSGDNGDDNYSKYELGTIEDGWFNLFVANNNSSNKTKINSNVSIDNSEEKITYDVNTNTYTVKVIKKFGSVQSNTEGLKYYTLGVLVNGSYDNLYLLNLSQEGVIDFKKLGSGTIDLLGWRFYNEDNLTTLTYIFDAYPKYGYSFKNLSFKFTDINNSSDTFTINNLPVYNGRNTITIDWKEQGIKSRKLYKVEIEVDLIKNNNPNDFSSTSFVRWFLSTNLMNDCYTANSSKFIKDYGNPDNDESSILNDKLTIKLQLNLNAVNNSKLDISKVPTNGTWFKLTRNNLEEIDIEYEHKYSLNISLQPEAVIENSSLYPDCIIVSNSGTPSVTSVTFNYENILFDPIIKGSDYNSNSLSGFIDSSGITKSNSKIGGFVKFYDKFKSKVSFNGSITNPFGDIDTYLKPIMFPTSNYTPEKFGGIGVDYDSSGGGSDSHCLNIFQTNYSPIEMEYSGGAAPPQNIGRLLARESKDGKWIFPYVEYADQINDYFDEKFGNQMCFYVYESEGKLGMHNSDTRPDSPNKFLNSAARVWFKSTDGWAIFGAYKERQTDPWTFVKDKMFKNQNLIYCFADSINCYDAGIAIPSRESYIYNNKYSIQGNLNINCTISNINITTGHSIQCKNNLDLKQLINFASEGTTIQKTTEYNNIILPSSEEFLEDVSNMIEGELNLNNLYINTALKKDILENDLNSTKFYKIDNNNNLVIEDNISNNIYINKDNPYLNGYFGILWKGTSKFAPSLRYDVTGWDHRHHWTLFDYQGIKTIS